MEGDPTHFIEEAAKLQSEQEKIATQGAVSNRDVLDAIRTASAIHITCTCAIISKLEELRMEMPE